MINEEEVISIQREEDLRVGRKGVFESQAALIYRRGMSEARRLNAYCGVTSAWGTLIPLLEEAKEKARF